MTTQYPFEILQSLWNQLYGTRNPSLLKNFLQELEDKKTHCKLSPQPDEWYKEAIIYSLYVDLFSNDFHELSGKLDYLADLGVNCLWLLPILDSPMRDAGFDIRDYYQIRPDLTGLPLHASKEDKLLVFRSFVSKANEKGIRVIFDIAMNHTSDQNPWFTEASKSEDNPYRNYYIWSKDTNLYREARLLFKGMVPSNWEKRGDWYFFHRFFEFQPDLNYRNPEVLVEMSKVLIFWMSQGVNGFRADAIPYLWKEEGTDCENLPNTHVIVKFFRAVLDYFRPNTLLLAEACQKPVEVVKYFGSGDECNAGYHFPLMPQMFKAVAAQSAEPVMKTLSRAVTPGIPGNAQWFTFLRCHDELSLELVYVSEEDRAFIHTQYCHQPEWDFRIGEGISARLAELMNRDERKILLAFSIMLSLPGSPVIYYGDEFGKLNDNEYYTEQIKLTGKNDTRFLVRGRIDWHWLEKELQNEKSLSYKVYKGLSELLKIRKNHTCFGKGSLQWLSDIHSQSTIPEQVLAFCRKFENETILCLHNLSDKEQHILLPVPGTPLLSHHELKVLDDLKNPVDPEDLTLQLKPYNYQWLRL